MHMLASLFTGIVVLTLALSGCASSTQPEVTPQPEASPVEDFASAPSTATSGSSMGAHSFSYLEGTWAITATDAEGDAGATADPSGEWEFAVMGESMTVYIGDRRYEGILTEMDDGWTYYGMVTGTNALGEPLGGYIEIVATDNDERSFTGALLQYLDPDGTAAAMSTRWDIGAARR